MEIGSRIGINPLRKLITRLEGSLLVWNQPLAAIILSGLIYTGISATAGLPWRLSTAPYYNLLADAFLNGQLYLRVIPSNPIDLSLFQNHYYLYWGPLPAILAMPVVALFGINFSDVLQTLFFSSINVGFLAIVLKAADEKNIIHLTPVKRALLVLFFALGTPYTPITESGHVWQMAQVESIMFVFLAYLAAFKLKNSNAFFLAGCAVAGILLTRPSAIFSALFLAWYMAQQHWHLGLRKVFLYSILGGLPVAFAIGMTGLYNILRFGNPLDNGLNYHLMSVYFADDFYRYGLFNIHFIPDNFYFTYILYPFSFIPPRVTVRCGSLFLLSPLFFCALYAIGKYLKKGYTWILLTSILLANIPILLLMGPGSSLFGPRYTLDFVMPLLLLTALGIETLPISFTSLLSVISILQYLLGSLIYVHGVP